MSSFKHHYTEATKKLEVVSFVKLEFNQQVESQELQLHDALASKKIAEQQVAYLEAHVAYEEEQLI